MLKVTHQPRWFAIGAFFVFKVLFMVIAETVHETNRNKTKTTNSRIDRLP